MEIVTIATVQFTGNAKTYDYVAVTQKDAASVREGAAGGQGICRVVVPGKIKDDGSLSLSIATVVSCREAPQDQAEELYPIVTAIPPAILDVAKVAVIVIDAMKAQEAAAKAVQA